MALDPRISLAATVPDLGRTFNNILSNVASLDTIKQNRLLAPILQQQQQSLLANQQTSTELNQGKVLDERNSRRLQELGVFGAQIKPFLDSGDIQGAKNLALNRINSLNQRIGRGEDVDTTETEQFINLLDTNPQLASQTVDQAINLARQFSGRGQGQTAGQRERQSLLATLRDPNASPVEKQSARIALGTEARAGSSAQERILGDPSLIDRAVTFEGEKAGAKTQAKEDVLSVTEPARKAAIVTAEGEAAIPIEVRRETQKANISRIKELIPERRKRGASIKKASKLLRAFKLGNAESGTTRAALGFIPGVFTDQAQFDESFGAFQEVAARAQLKANGEIRPTDADVEGMKRAIFGPDRDEATNIALLQEFITTLRDQDDELDDLLDAQREGNLDVFTISPQRNVEDLSDEDLFN